MRENDEFIRQVEDYLAEFDGAIPLPGRVIDAIHAELPRTRQAKARPGFMPLMSSKTSSRAPWGSAALAKLGMAAVAIAVIGVVGLTFLRPPSVGPAPDLGIFAPVSGRILSGVWAVDPAAVDPSAPSRSIALHMGPEKVLPVGWSSDGTKLLFMREDPSDRSFPFARHLFILLADGSEIQLTREAMEMWGATIAPDGSRVVFAAAADVADPLPPSLFAVDADGGEPVRIAALGSSPTFSPDGKRIAYVTHSQGPGMAHVWVADADGSDAHEILAGGPALSPGSFDDLAWSPAGDRIALVESLDANIYTFAPDGSDFTKVISGGMSPFWSPDGSQIAYTPRSSEPPQEGLTSWWARHQHEYLPPGLAIADADGSNVREFGFAASGPWHPDPLQKRSEASVSPSPFTSPTASPWTLEPVAGPIECGNPDREVRARVPIGDGIVGAAGTILGCSRDGSRLLIQRGLAGNLFVLHGDGSETQVSEPLSGSSDITGSARPTGATISPDGLRVVFAGKTVRGRSCHDGALFAVDADGGPAKVLWESQRDGIVRDPMFSPDGTKIAFADGYCDSDQSVWVMNVDGSDAHRIVGPIGAGHVYGLAWSPAGDRIALALEAEIYAFATDGSNFTQAADTSEFCWPGLRC